MIWVSFVSNVFHCFAVWCFPIFFLSGYGQELRVLQPPSKDKVQHVFFGFETGHRILA